MAIENDKVKDLYNFLRDEGYDFMGSESDFREKVSDSNSVNSLHDFLRDEGYDFMGTREDFYGKLNPADTPVSSTDQRPKAATQQHARPEQVYSQAGGQNGQTYTPGRSAAQTPALQRPQKAEQRKPAVTAPATPASVPTSTRGMVEAALGKPADTGFTYKGVTYEDTSKFVQGIPQQKDTVDLAESIVEDSKQQADAKKAKKERQDTTRSQVDELSNSIDEQMQDWERRAKTALEDKMKSDANIAPRSATSLVRDVASYMATKNRSNGPVDVNYNTPEIKALTFAKRSLDNAKNMIAEADHNAAGGFEGSFVAGVGRGFGQKFTDLSTWDFGASDLVDATTFLRILEKADKGEALSKSEQALLDAKVIEIATSEYFGDEVGRGYKAGSVTAESIPFMIEMMVNPIAGAGQGAEKMLARYALKRFARKGIAEGATKTAALRAAKKSMEKGGEHYVAGRVASGVGRAVGDVLAAPGIAATTGSLRTAADAVNRRIGDVQFKTDTDGRSVYDYRKDAASWFDAWRKAFLSTSIENYSEMFGNYFSPLLGAAGKGAAGIATSRFGKALRLDKVYDMLNNVSSSDWARLVSDFENRANWHGTLGEFSEELVGGVLNAILVGDQTLDTDKQTGVFNLDNLIDTFLGVSLMGGAFSAVNTGGYALGRHRLNRADAAGRDTFGEEWDMYQSSLSSEDDAIVKQTLKSIAEDKNLSEDQKKAAFRYANAAYGFRTVLSQEEKRREDPETDPAEQAVRDSFANGYDAGAEEQRDIMIEAGMGEPTEARQAAADGVRQRIEDDADMEVEGWREEGRKMMHSDGSIRPAVLKVKNENGEDTEVYIVEGNVQMMADGTMVDPETSDRSVVIYDPATGERKMIEPTSDMGILSIGEATSAEDFEYEIQRRRDEYVQRMLDEAQGTVRVELGQSLTMPDGREGTVMAISPDGESFTVVANDCSGEVRMERSDLQQVADAAALADYQARHQEDEATAEQPTEEETDEPTAVAPGTVEGAPTEFLPDMDITILDDAGNEQPATVMGIVRYERGKFVPDETGNIVEYVVDGQVKHENTAKLAEKVVSHVDANLAAQETPAEQPAAVEQPTVETPTAEVETPAAEPVVEATGTVAEQPTVEPMPMREDGEADFLATTPERGHQFIYNEAGLSREEAGQFVKANLEMATKALDKAKKDAPKMGTSLVKYKQQQAEHQAKVDAAQQAVDYWQGVKATQSAIVSAEMAEQAERDRVAHEAAVLAEQQRQAEEIAKQEEQAALGSNAVAPQIVEKWQSVPKLEGAANEITLADGSKVKGHYVIVESGAATPSHNPNMGFVRNDGFPIDENGQTVNDRDYERDQDAQQITRQMADSYDSRAIQNVPVVSPDGVVLSGNGRTMAGELAAQQGTDGEYIDHLKKYPQQFGFEPQQFEGMEHPRLLFVADEAMPYTTETFAKFNQQDMKSQSRTEQSVKMGKTVDDNTFGRIIRSINSFDSLADFYNDPVAASNAIGELHGAGAINNMQLADMMDGEKVSGNGRQTLENMLIGKAFESNPDAIRQLAEFPAMRQSVVSALAEIANNIRLGEDYSLESELAQAINLAYQARKNGVKAGDKVSWFARQQSLFPFDTGETVADFTNATVLMLADCINDSRVSQLKKVLGVYNQKAESSAAGQYNIFSGVINSKSDILKEVTDLFDYGTAQEQQSALDNAVEQRKQAAAVQQPGGEESVPEGSTVEGSDAGSVAEEVTEPQATEDHGQTERTETDRRDTGDRLRDAVPSGAQRGDSGVDIGSLAEGLAAERSGDRGRSQRADEEAVGHQIIDNAKKSGVFIDRSTLNSFGERVRKPSGESVVYVDKPNNRVVKVKDPYAKDNLKGHAASDALYEHIVHNLLFPNTQYRLIGISDDSVGDVRFVLEQDIIKNTTPATQQDIDWYLINELGLTKVEKPYLHYENDYYSITDVDASGDNVFIDGEGAICFIDPIIKFKKPAQEVINFLTTGNAIAAAEAEVDTNPTEGQKEAGNYKKGHLKLDGYDITIEQPKGSIRRGTDDNGKQWEQEMHNTYGYIRGTEGVDGDHIDVFLSDDPTSGDVFVVDQVDQMGIFDEHKVMYGFPDIESAKAAYLSNYEEGWQGCGAITPVSKEEFKKWIESSHRKTKPFAEYASVKTLGDVQVENMPAEEHDSERGAYRPITNEWFEIGDNVGAYENGKVYHGDIIDWDGEKFTIRETISRRNGKYRDHKAWPINIKPGSKKATTKPAATAEEQPTEEQRVIGQAMVDQLENMGMEVSTDISENRRVHRQAEQDNSEAGKLRHFRTSDGNVYGFSYRGKIYIDPRRIDAELPIHEYAHPWCEAFRMLNPEGWQEVVDMMQGDKETWNLVQRMNPDLTDANDIAEEMIAIGSGKNGKARAEAEYRRMGAGGNFGNVWNNIAKSIQDFWKRIGDFLGIKYESTAQVYDQVVKDFANKVNPRKRIENYLKERDNEYMQAVESGDEAKAKDLFDAALRENIGNGMTPYVAAGGYRGSMDRLARGVKSRDPKVVTEVADLMAPLIPDNAILVPAPSHSGTATDMLDVANAIAERTGAPVADVLKSEARESQYESKRESGRPITATQMGITMTGELPDGMLPVVIDNVVNSGNTAEACVKALGKGVVVSLADAADRRKHVSSLKSANVVALDKNGNVVPLSQRFTLGGSNYLAKQKGEQGNRVSEVTKALRDGLVSLLRSAGLDVVANKREGQRMLDKYRELAKLLRVWHGSGADFDRFDHSKMGTGEGAQAFGYGTYVTEVKGIGKNYAEKIGKKRRNYNEILESKNLTNEDRAVVNDINKEPFALSEKEKVERLKARYEEEIKKAEENVKSGTPILEAIDEAMKIIEEMTDLEWEKYSENKSGRLAELDDYLSENVGFIEFLDEKAREQALKTGNVDRETALSLHRQAEELNREAQEKLKSLSWISNALSRYGRILYEVEIPDDNGSNYLDYDGYVTEAQYPMWYEAMKELGEEDHFATPEKHTPSKDGNTSVSVGFEIKAMGNRYTSEAVSKALHDAGFTGIKYPAQFTTGGREDNAKNYVIFDENDLKITDKIRFHKAEDGEYEPEMEGDYKFFKTPDGEVYGFTVGGEIYIDPSVATAETPIHEYTHLWAQALRKANPQAWERLKEEMKAVEGGRLWEYVKSKYPELEQEDELMEEVFAHYSGRRGAERLESDMREAMAQEPDLTLKAQVALVFHKLRDALQKFWTMARDLFAGKVEGLEGMTAEDFADMALGDLLRGFDPRVVRSEREEKTLINPRNTVPNVRGGWNERKIKDYLKHNSTRSGVYTAARAISEFDNVEELKDHMFYHGTVYGGEKLKPSITMSERDAERYGGGGYGERYWGISLTKSKKVASHFSGMSNSMKIYPVILLKGAKVVERPDMEDAADLEGHIVELWNDGVDAVWIGKGKQGEGEQELCVINPRAVVNIGTPDFYNVYQLGTKENPLRISDDAAIKKMYETAKEYASFPKPNKPFKPIKPSRLNDKLEWKSDEEYAAEMDAYEQKLSDYEQRMEEYNNSEELRKYEEMQDKARKDIRYQKAEKQDMALADLLRGFNPRERTAVHREGEADGDISYGDWFDQGSVERIGAFMGDSRKRIDAMKERQKASVRKRLEEQIEKMGLKDRVVMVESADELGDVSEEDRRSKGWYDVETGKIVIVLDNHTSSDDVIATILHEGVAHYGLRQLFGKHFDTFLDNVYASATEEVRGAITNLAANKYGWNIREATEEYIAGLAEDTDFESPERQSWWAQIKHFFWDMLHKLGIAGQHIKDAISDNELRYLLWRSYQNLVNPGRYRSLVEEAEDIAMQWNLQVGRYEERYGELHSERAGRWYAPARAAESGINLDEVEKIEARPEADGYVSGVSVRLTMTDGNTYNLWVQTDTDDGQRGVTEFYGNDDEGVPDEEMTQRFGRFFGHDVNEIFGSRIGFMLLESARVNRNGITLNREQISQFKQPSKAAERMHRDGDFSPRDNAIARDYYERMVSQNGYQVQEAMQDSMLGLRKAMQAILGAGKDFKIEEVAGNENAYLAENRMSSTNAAEQHNYFRQWLEPLLKAVHELAGSKAAEREALTNYMMAKHGLERNEKFAERDFVAYQQQYPTGGKTLADFRQNDYAGLTALTGEQDVVDAEAVARQMVADYEALHDTSELWDAVNTATKVTLAKMYRGGLMSKESYEHTRDMFEYYIPLRGFDETTSDEVYGYLTSRQGPLGSSILKHAEGRRSKADDPIATIAMMADQAIMQANRNEMKQRFLTFVQNHPSDLVSVSKLWLQYDAAADEWVPVFADIDEGDTAADVARKVEAFEQRMEQLAANDPDNYKSGKEAANIPYRVLPGNMNEHQVLVKRAGETFVLTINGNPRAAQALNGLTNPDVKTGGFIGGFMKASSTINRFLSSAYTTRTPDFVVSNFFRDMLYSNCMAWVKDTPSYALRFHKNFGRFNPVTMRVLFGKWENGKLDDSKPTEYMFKQFMMNGGETGYTNVRDIEAQKRRIVKELRRQGSAPRKVLHVLGEQLDLVNQSVENCARFAAFITSQELGRSIERSIYDAKEVSVNFNKKGSGDKMMGAEGQTKIGNVAAFLSGAGRCLQVFWNAGVQGMTNFGRAAKRKPGKFAAASATMFTLGAVIPLIAKALAGDGDDDDKNAYYNLPEYVRRSNICFRVGDSWITIPLPIEFRAIYGLGELGTGVITGEEHYSDGELARQMVAQVSQILPLDFMEGQGGLHNLWPSWAKPLVEGHNNKGWTGLPIYRDTPFNQSDPEFTKVYKSADKHIVAASKWLNEITGGDDYKKGWADVVNPAQVEYVLNGYFGGYFKVPNQLIKMTETATGNREFEWRNMMIANRLIKSGDERTAHRKLQNEYFKYKEEYEETKRLKKKYEKAADEGVVGYAEKVNFLNNSEEYARYLIFDEYRKDINDLYNLQKEETDEEKRKEYEAEYYQVMREMVDAMHAYEKSKGK